MNELLTRDKVTTEMISVGNSSDVHLIIDEKIAEEVGPAMQFYLGKKLFSTTQGILNLSRELNMKHEILHTTISDINSAASGNDPGPNFIRRPRYHPFDLNGKFLHAKVVPAVHYTMGGLKIDPSGRVLSRDSSEPIKGLFAAGEVTGGLHGDNRLGGNSLLECTVFGRRAGKAAVFSTPSI